MTQQDKEFLEAYTVHLRMAHQTFTIPNVPKSDKQKLFEIYQRINPETKLTSPYCYNCLVRIMSELYPEFIKPTEDEVIEE